MTRLWSPETPLRMVLCAGLLLLALSPASSQVNSTTTDTGGGSGDDMQLRVPPPVNGQAYSTEFAGESEQNYWRAGFTLNSAWSSNITGGAHPVGDMSYSFWPTIALNKITYRSQLLLNYSPGFTIYQRSSGYNQADQNVNVSFQYRISPTVTLGLQEGFHKTSNIFNQPDPTSASPVSGSLPPPGVTVIAPLADLINTATAAQLTWQVGADSMLGASGTFNYLYYPNPDQAAGVYNSRAAGGSIFYSRRLNERYYLGATYQYQNISSDQANSPNTRTQTQTVFAFLSIYLKPTLSLSISGGPQHYASTQLPFPPASSWSPMFMVSMGWQGNRTALAASYSRMVGSGGGLNGAYHANMAAVSANWKVSREWTAGVGASYSGNTTLTPLFLSSAGGRTISGTVSAQRTLGEHASVQFGYSWTNQNYRQIAAIASTPNVNRVFVSVNYQFSRPLQK